MNKFLAVACMAIGIASCNSKKDYDKVFKDPILYCKTVYQLNGVVMGNNFSPMVASRNYLYANVAAYEVIAAGYPNQYTSLAGQLKGLKFIPAPVKGSAVDFEFASLLAFCKLGEAVTFPAGSMSEFVDSLKKLATDHGMPSDVFKNSVEYAGYRFIRYHGMEQKRQLRANPQRHSIYCAGFTGALGANATCIFARCRATLE